MELEKLLELYICSEIFKESIGTGFRLPRLLRNAAQTQLLFFHQFVNVKIPT